MTSRALIVAYHFPPYGGAGSQRPLKFAKYLAASGWKVDIVTRDTGNFGRWDPEDVSLLHDVPISTLIHRVTDSAKSGSFSTDPMSGWSEKAIALAHRLVSENQYNFVLVTMSPFSLAEHAGRILSRNSNCPTILDFRDPWVFDGWHPKKTALHWLVDYWRANKALKRVDGAIFNTTESQKVYKSRTLLNCPTTAIPNGFDSEDFGPRFTAPKTRQEGRFLIVHTGSLHSASIANRPGVLEKIKRKVRFSGESIEPAGRSLFYVLQALEYLHATSDPIVDSIVIRCVGEQTDDDIRMVTASSAAANIEFTGYVTHRDSISQLEQADALLLLLHGTDSGKSSRIVPGKTYEYLAARRPILACVPNGDAKELVQRSGLGTTCDPLSPIEISNAIRKVYNSCNNERPTSAFDWLHSYERKNLTTDLVEFVNLVASGKS